MGGKAEPWCGYRLGKDLVDPVFTIYCNFLCSSRPFRCTVVTLFSFMMIYFICPLRSTPGYTAGMNTLSSYT